VQVSRRYYYYLCGETVGDGFLLVSTAGLTFFVVAQYVVQFAWGVGEQADRIYYSHFNQKSGNQQRLTYWSHNVDFCYTDNFGLGKHTAVMHGNKFGVFQGYWDGVW